MKVLNLIMNYKLIKVFGIIRSGNHPIINWIMGLTQNKGLFFNNRKVYEFYKNI